MVQLLPVLCQSTLNATCGCADEVDVDEQLLELTSEGTALRQKRSLLAPF